MLETGSWWSVVAYRVSTYQENPKIGQKLRNILMQSVGIPWEN